MIQLNKILMKKTLILFFSCLVMRSDIQAQNVFQKWANCFNDNSIGQPYPNDMVTDENGNTYITGYLAEAYPDFYNKHYFLLKINAAGVQQWINYYPVSDTSDKTKYDIGKSLALDKQGNIYVAGERFDTVCNICTIQTKYKDLFNIKYDPDGNLVWLNRYNGPDNTYQSPENIAIDKNGFLLVVANEAKYNNKTFDYNSKMLIQKINKNGKTAWIRKVKATVGNGISSDADGNVLVAGASNIYNIYSRQKPLVTKYSSTGDSLWTKVFDEYNKNGRAYSVGADAQGNVYVNGQTDTNTFYNNPKIVTIKYSTGGNLLWSRKEIDNTNTQPHIYGSFSVDANGRSYIAGSLSPYQVRDNWITSVYEANGNLAWSNQYADAYGGNDKPADLVTDSQGNLYVTGYASNAQYDYMYTTIKYNAAGVQQWLKTYRYATPHSNNFGNNIGLDAVGNVYVTGISAGGVCTVKYGINSSSLKQDKIAENKISIFPNPVQNILHIKLETRISGNLYYKIFNIDGSLFSEGILNAQSPQDAFDINVQNLTKGIHLTTLKIGEKLYKVSFIKE